jgi:hypothetical protein
LEFPVFTTLHCIRLNKCLLDEQLKQGNVNEMFCTNL